MNEKIESVEAQGTDALVTEETSIDQTALPPRGTLESP